MSILVDQRHPPGRPGHHRARGRVPRRSRCRRTARKVVAGMTPGKGGQTRARRDACRSSTPAPTPSRETGANTTVIYVPAAGRAGRDPRGASARASGPIFCITEHIPALDMLKVVAEVERAGARLVGPNCPGATSPGKAKVGIIPGTIHKPGHVGLVSRSGTLTYEVVQAMTDAGIGQSTCVGIGGDPITGSTFIDILALFRDDPETEAHRAHRARSAAAPRRQPPPGARRISRTSRWSRSSPAAPRRPAAAWATPARSSAAAAAPLPARSRRWRRPASAWPSHPREIPRLLIEAGIRPD